MNDTPPDGKPATPCTRNGDLGPPDNAAGYTIHMIRPHLKDIPAAPLPQGFSIRPLQRDEGHLWLTVERDAEEYLTIGDDTFEREFGHDLDSVPQRCFLITSPDGTPVGTISAWYYTYRKREYGLIHWVAVRPAWQRRGLGKAGLVFALERLSQWHEMALLGTQSRRLPAIRLYLDYGFLPDLEEDNAAQRWQHVSAHLDHPVLRQLGL